MEAAEVGRLLAGRHEQARAAEVDQVNSLLNYPEAPHRGDWTLRSALVRLAQPEPERVATLLQLSRRLDAALHHVARALEKHAVVADRSLDPTDPAGPVAEAVPDARAADIARLVAAGVDEREVMAGYGSVAPLDREERLAVPILAVAVELERLAARLADWADAGPEDPPIEEVDRVTAAAGARIEELGVPEETGPPPGARSRG